VTSARREWASDSKTSVVTIAKYLVFTAILQSDILRFQDVLGELVDRAAAESMKKSNTSGVTGQFLQLI
jgi:hypothetical protein